MQLLKRITPSQHGRTGIKVLQTSGKLYRKGAVQGMEDTKESFKVLLLPKSKPVYETDLFSTKTWLQ